MTYFQNDPVCDYLEFSQVLYLLFLKCSHGNRYQADELQSQYTIDYCSRIINRDVRDDWIYSERSSKDDHLLSTCSTLKNFLRSVPLVYPSINLFLVPYGESNFFQNMSPFILEPTEKNRFLSESFEEGFKQNGNFKKKRLFFSRVIESLISWDPSNNLEYIPNNPVNRATSLLKDALVKEGAYQKETMRRKEVEAVFNSLFPPSTAAGRVFSKRQRDAVIESVLMWDPLNLEGANDE